mmetsp:Transcript_6081/g.13480  ORF Transcript_6081/g.13480 Transcript_6081/m.13480 type:complete len:1156 (+) Transcript_6081:132-3599(+)
MATDEIESELHDGFPAEDLEETKALGAAIGRIRVVLRLKPALQEGQAGRPPLNQQLTLPANLAVKPVEGKKPTVRITYDNPSGPQAPPQTKEFDFDSVLPSSASQTDLFAEVGLPVLHDCLNGINGAILAYGQTGSGKTHSLLHRGEASEEAGLLPRMAFNLFVRIARDSAFVYEVEAAAVQVYNEQVDDLLHKDYHHGGGHNISLIESHDVPNLTWVSCEDPEEMLKTFESARENVIYAETKLNKASSRSHAIFQVRLSKRPRAKEQQLNGAVHMVGCRKAKLLVIDLAGSERVKKSGVAGINFREASNINRSLLVLGNVMSALAKQQRHVPFRESKLTRLLDGHLGGNCRTVLLVCASTEKEQAHETLSTLQFGSRAMSVKVAARVNSGMVEVNADAVLAEQRRDRKLEALRLGKAPDVESTLLRTSSCNPEGNRPALLSPTALRRRIRSSAPPLHKGPLNQHEARKLQVAAEQAQQAGRQWQAEALRLKDDLDSIEKGSREEVEHLKQAMRCAEELAAEWQSRAESEADSAMKARQALQAEKERVRHAESELAASRREAGQQLGSAQSELAAARREAQALSASASRHAADDSQRRERSEEAEALLLEWQTRAEAAEASLRSSLAEAAQAKDADEMADLLQQEREAAARASIQGATREAQLAERMKELESKSVALAQAEADVQRLEQELKEREREVKEAVARQQQAAADQAARAEADGLRKGLLEARAAMNFNDVSNARLPSPARNAREVQEHLEPEVVHVEIPAEVARNKPQVEHSDSVVEIAAGLRRIGPAQGIAPGKVRSTLLQQQALQDAFGNHQDADGQPSESDLQVIPSPIRPPAEWVQNYVQGIGVDKNADAVLFEALSMALKAPLQQGWGMYGDANGSVYFWNEFNSSSSWTHPDHEIFVSALELRQVALRQRDPAAYMQRALRAVNAEDVVDIAGRWLGPFQTEDGQQYWHSVQEGSSVWHDPWAEAQRMKETRLSLLHVLLEDMEDRKRAALKMEQAHAAKSIVALGGPKQASVFPRQSTARGRSRQDSHQLQQPLADNDFLEEDALSRHVADSIAHFTKGEVELEMSHLPTESVGGRASRAPSEATTGWRSRSQSICESSSPLAPQRPRFSGVSNHHQAALLASPLRSVGRQMIESSSAPAL